MTSTDRICILLLVSIVLVSRATGQDRSTGGGSADKSLLQRFDSNGDGKIDDTERRAVREKMKQMQNKPGARTPSGKTETVGNREVTEMEYASSDGQKIPCVLSMPKGNGPFPMLVTIHGGQGNRDLGYIRTMAAPHQLSPTISAFNEQPWAILAISYRSGNGALFGKEHDDVIAGIRFAKTLPKVDPSRVGVVGGSHGGHLALVAAEKMGQEFLCVAVGSPWMTDPVVYMMGDPNSPPLSLVSKQARDELTKNGQSLFNGLTRGRGMSEAEAKDFLAKNSIEANADKIEIPTLFVTSRGDDQAPYVLIEPMIRRMQTAKKEVSVYTAEKSPHGFYWARTVSAARDLRGEKTPQEAEEELTARRTMIEFFTKQFARKDVKADSSSTNKPKPDPSPARDDDPAESKEMPSKDSSENSALHDRGLGRANFQSLAGDTVTVTRDAFKKQLSGSAAFSSRLELADRIFDRLDTDGDGSLNETEYKAMNDLKSQFGRSGQPGPAGRGANRSGRAGGSMLPNRQPAPRDATKPEDQASNSGSSNDVAKTSPIHIATGDLVGEQAGDVRIFRGVPYAAPPTGAGRWQAPSAPQSWSGVRQATQFGSTALQGETFTPRSSQSEDCLFLNIWTPSGATAESKLPVLFWIHGGAFIQGSGGQPRYDGTELAKRGAVVISINYRLGPLGLFAHPALTAESKSDEPLGNYCLLDMIAALHWTRDNVAAFGGDPGNVTISGSSAGGTSCSFLMGIPQTEGLFHKAIIHSSGGIQNIQTLSEAEAAGLRLAERLGIGAKTTGTELRRVATADVAIGVGAIRELSLPVKPIIDGRLVTATRAA